MANSASILNVLCVIIINSLNDEHLSLANAMTHESTSSTLEEQRSLPTLMQNMSTTTNRIVIATVGGEKMNESYSTAGIVTEDAMTSPEITPTAMSMEDTSMTILVDNTTYVNTSASSNVTEQFQAATPEAQAEWSRIMDQSQIGITSVGFLANVMTLITLMRDSNRKEFNPTILFLLRHQTLIDALVCLAGCMLLVLPPMWSVGIYPVDQLICHIWHSQQFYWGTVLVSIWSLVLIALERFYAVCKPFKHQDFTVRRTIYILVLTYFLSIILTSGSFFQVHMQDSGVCISEYLVPGTAFEVYMVTFAISTWFSFFSIPTALFIYLYGRVVHVFRQRQQKSGMAASRVIDKATSELTKTAIVVTIIFILSVGYDSTSYVFGNIGVSEYKMGSPSQKIGVLLSLVNSFANPFVYTLLLPVYRKQVTQTFCCCCVNKPQDQPAEGSGPSSRGSATTSLGSSIHSKSVSSINVSVVA